MFAKGCTDQELGDVMHKLDDRSLSELVREHQSEQTEDPASLGLKIMPIEIFRGRVLSTEKVAAIRREIESFSSIEAADDEMRALILRSWPVLAAKLTCRSRQLLAKHH